MRVPRRTCGSRAGEWLGTRFKPSFNLRSSDSTGSAAGWFRSIRLDTGKQARFAQNRPRADRPKNQYCGGGRRNSGGEKLGEAETLRSLRIDLRAKETAAIITTNVSSKGFCAQNCRTSKGAARAWATCLAVSVGCSLVALICVDGLWAGPYQASFASKAKVKASRHSTIPSAENRLRRTQSLLRIAQAYHRHSLPRLPSAILGCQPFA